MASEVKLGLILGFIIFSCIVLACKGTVIASHDDAEVDLPLIAASKTVSSQICLHRCALDNDCNVACVGKATENEFYCMFFNLVKIATLKDHLRQRMGFIVYEVPRLARETQVYQLCLPELFYMHEIYENFKTFFTLEITTAENGNLVYLKWLKNFPQIIFRNILTLSNS